MAVKLFYEVGEFVEVDVFLWICIYDSEGESAFSVSISPVSQ